jgi:hypothetical protein
VVEGPPLAEEPAPSPAPLPPGGARSLAGAAGALVAVAFFALGLATLGANGITWDEPESYRAGAQNLRLVAAALAGRPLPPWPWHALPGYQFAADTLRAAVAAAGNRVLWQPGSPLGFQLVNLGMAALAVAATARLAAREGAARWLGPLAATLLVLHPKLVAHAQANPKDVVALLAWCLAALAVARAARRGRTIDFALLGAALGAALASHVSGVLLAPFAVVWVLAAGSGGVARRTVGLALAGGVALAVTLLLWPWLWPAPWERALFLLERMRAFEVPMRVLYLGHVYGPAELPWHYGLVSLAIATPVPHLVAAVLGLATAARGGASARLCRFATLWLALFVAADLAAPARYDGARHFLPALPALALLAAGGIHGAGATLSSSARGRRARVVLSGALAASLLFVAGELAAIHPYADAFLSLPARLWLGHEAQHEVELEYWGGSYKEGAAWLRAHAEPGSFVLVPMGPHAAAPFLDGFRLVPHDSWPDRSRPHYLLLMTREAWYTPRLSAIAATQTPLHSVRRQGSTLLSIYRVSPR